MVNFSNNSTSVSLLFLQHFRTYRLKQQQAEILVFISVSNAKYNNKIQLDLEQTICLGVSHYYPVGMSILRSYSIQHTTV